MYDPETDMTLNSQTNFSTEIPDSGYILVELDGTGKDPNLWPVSFTTVNGSGNISDQQYTGKELEEESEISEEPSENSEESEESDVSEVSDEPSESNEDEIVIQVSAEYSAPTSVKSNTVVTRTPLTDTGVAYKPAESPATGDTTVPAVLIVISAAASGIAFVLFRKCTGR